MDRGLIRPSGRAETPGRPLLYTTTPAFMVHFGLGSLEDLPRPKELTTDEEALENRYEKTWKPPPDAEASAAAAGQGHTPLAEEQPHGTTGETRQDGQPPPGGE